MRMRGSLAVTLEEDLLWRAFVDWVPDSEVLHLVRKTGIEDPATLRDLSIGLITRLLFEEKVIAGHPAHDGFAQWEGSTSDAVQRIVSSWLNAPSPMVILGEVVWLCATPRGLAIGQAVCEREGWC